jgi:hypothetical protein
MVGCGGSSLTTAVKPVQDATVQPPSVTDTVRVEQVAPVPPPGRPTAPIRVQAFDTTTGPSGPVSRVEVSASDVSLYRPDGTVITYESPAFGEELDIAVHPGSTSGEVRGRPRADTVQARVPDDKDKGLLAKAWNRLAWIGLFVVVGGGLYLLRGFVPSVGLFG